MAQRQNYNTKARQHILDYLESQSENMVSASDIIEYLNKKGISINLTTVYRNLNKLSDEHKIIKYVDETTQRSVYQFVGQEKACDDHLHIKCVNCGKLIHFDCGFINDIKNHLVVRHNFELQCEGSILYGVCDRCKLSGM